jgi:hypothetical protein
MAGPCGSMRGGHGVPRKWSRATRGVTMSGWPVGSRAARIASARSARPAVSARLPWPTTARGQVEHGQANLGVAGPEEGFEDGQRPAAHLSAARNFPWPACRTATLAQAWATAKRSGP